MSPQRKMARYTDGMALPKTIQWASCYWMHGCKPNASGCDNFDTDQVDPLAMRQVHRNWIGIFGQLTSPQKPKGKVSLCFASDRSEQVESNRHVVINSCRHVAMDFFKKILEFWKVWRRQLHLWRKPVSMKAKMYLWREDVFMKGKLY